MKSRKKYTDEPMGEPKVIKDFLPPPGRLTLKAREIDKKFDKGEDISKYLDMSKAKRPGRERKGVNVGVPSENPRPGTARGRRPKPKEPK